jgi:sugar phosphate isomerase/epimerase
MKLGFVSAILPDLSLECVLQFAAETGYDCVEIMCWPPSKAERRYAGITHIDVEQLDDSHVARINSLCGELGVAISGLGYYPNALSPDEAEAKLSANHIRSVIDGAASLGLSRVNTFIGRDWTKSVDDNWPRLLETWKPLIEHAESVGVYVGIENCPMLFTEDEWPGGKNIATSPQIWRRLFSDVGSDYLGLNYDPSHMIWQQMDYLQPMHDFKDRMFHVHAKDVRLDQDKLDDVGILAHPNQYHIPKLPGMGDVDWGKFFSILTDTGYQGAVCVEVEDRAYEGSLNERKAALIQSHTFLRNFVPKALPDG